MLAARQVAKLDAVAAACRQLGAQVLCVPTDVSVRADCEALIAQAVQQFGRIDTLINNAGISAQALLHEVDAAHLDWYEDLMRVNLWGTIWCTHAALPHLKASRGRIVAVSSSPFFSAHGDSQTPRRHRPKRNSNSTSDKCC